jgi:pimeloyl-ACP methyl ester carboxylesterase
VAGLVERRDVLIESDEVTLAGSIWLPTMPPRSGVVMHPGSGPSDRDNDGYFATLRNSLVNSGHAVSSYDKRGVGGSSGRWEDAPIETQGRDLIAAADRLADFPEMKDVPIGLFGHSQGGWVALDAASRRPYTSFLIVNSGPGVAPWVQERYAARMSLENSGADNAATEKGLAHYDLVTRLARARTPWEQVKDRNEELAPYLPGDPWAWHFWMTILDFDPARALSSIHIPILTLWGERDRLVPVEESISVYRVRVPPTRLVVEVFPDADHRVQVGDPPRLAPGYTEAVLGFIDSHLEGG